METIADRIKKKREEIGFSQEDLAIKMGYSNKSSVSQIEASGDKISMMKIEKCAEALHVSVPYLMGWDFEMSKEDVRAFEELHDYTIKTDATMEIDKVLSGYSLYEKEQIEFLMTYLLNKVIHYNQNEYTFEEEILIKSYRNKSPDEQKAFRTLLGI